MSNIYQFPSSSRGLNLPQSHSPLPYKHEDYPQDTLRINPTGIDVIKGIEGIEGIDAHDQDALNIDLPDTDTLAEGLQGLRSAADHTAFVRTLHKAFFDMGFSHFALMQINKDSQTIVRCTRFPCGLKRKLQRFDLDRNGLLVDYYNGGNVDAVLLSSFEAFVGCVPFKTRSLETNTQAIALCKRFGFEDMYFTICDKHSSRRGNKWVLALASQDIVASTFRHVVNERKSVVQQVFRTALDVLAIRTRNFDCPSAKEGDPFDFSPPEKLYDQACRLKGKQLKLLQLLATRASSLSAAAKMMGISRSTANRYMSEIKILLNAKSVAQAVCYAQAQRII